MKTLRILFAATLFTALPFGLTGCGGDSHEAAMTDMADTMGEVADIIKNVKDKDSATEAAKKIDALIPEIEAIAKRMEALGEPSPDEAMALMQTMMTKLTPTAMKMAEASAALAGNPEAMAALQPALDRFKNAGGSMGDFGN